MLGTVLALVAASCSADGFEPEPLGNVTAPDTTVAPIAPEPSNVTSAQVTALPLDASSIPDGQLTAEQQAQVIAWYSGFLNARNQYYVGEAGLDDVGIYINDRNVMAELPELQDAYLGLLEQESIVATKQFASFPNASNMTATRGRITFDDCLETQALSILDIVGFRWVNQQVTLAQQAGEWVIVELDVVHDGEPWTDPYGCAPDSFSSRALEITEALMQENRTYQQDPSLFNDRSFPYFEEDQMRDIFAGAVVEQRNEGIEVVSPEEWRYDVLGLNVGASLIGWAVTLDVCSHRPEGILYRLDGGDEILTDTTVDPGFSLQYRVTTLLEQVTEGVDPVDQILAVEIVGTGCW